MVDLYIDREEAAGLSPDSRFLFSCHPGLACFNQCCRQPTVILKPYDIMRLRHRLGITSTEFLEKYTTKVVENKSYLPLVMLDIDQEAGRGCPFLEAAGCGVYEDRPGACRLFPITQGSNLGKEGVEDTYFCKRLDFCQGFAAGREWTLARWQADQDLEPYDTLNREWLEIILKRGDLNPPREDARASAIFSMVAYDIDKFRRFVLETPFLEIFEIPREVAAGLQKSDVELLRLGYKYLKIVLLIEDPERMKEKMQTRPQPLNVSTSRFFF
jgi:Fe-S-cluster containining protein